MSQKLQGGTCSVRRSEPICKITLAVRLMGLSVSGPLRKLLTHCKTCSSALCIPPRSAHPVLFVANAARLRTWSRQLTKDQTLSSVAIRSPRCSQLAIVSIPHSHPLLPDFVRGSLCGGGDCRSHATDSSDVVTPASPWRQKPLTLARCFQPSWQSANAFSLSIMP